MRRPIQPGTPAVSPVDRSSSAPVTMTARTMRTVCTMKPVVEVRTPELRGHGGR